MEGEVWKTLSELRMNTIRIHASKVAEEVAALVAIVVFMTASCKDKTAAGPEGALGNRLPPHRTQETQAVPVIDRDKTDQAYVAPEEVLEIQLPPPRTLGTHLDPAFARKKSDEVLSALQSKDPRKQRAAIELMALSQGHSTDYGTKYSQLSAMLILRCMDYQGANVSPEDKRTTFLALDTLVALYDGKNWPEILRAIQALVDLDLPVLKGDRPEDLRIRWRNSDIYKDLQAAP
jgi:hypothetical protein